jgi:hypothetical protein
MKIPALEGFTAGFYQTLRVGKPVANYSIRKENIS